MNGNGFNEQDYLAVNPDVEDAVKKGIFKSGLDHFIAFGKKEGRKIKKMLGELDRVDKALSLLSKKGLGLEIGPSHNPVAPKRKGFNVHIVDHLDANGLRQKYEEHDVNAKNIEEVDFVWDGRPLPELIGQTACYDWIIASHVIEHVPDFVGFLQQCQDLIKEGGYISLIIPDKRYCFDCLNAPTSTGQFLDAFEESRRRPSVGQVFDHFSNACKRGDQIAWGEGNNGPVSLIHSIEQSKQMWQQAKDTSEYMDVHCWRFTPESFRLALSDLQMLGLLQLEIAKEFETTGCEFYVTLSRQKNIQYNDHRLQMLLNSKLTKNE